MSRDKFILYFLWVLMCGLLLKFIPKNRIRQGLLMFFYKQTITWVFGLLVADKGLIKYPVRFFKSVYKSSFSFEYFFYPCFCAFFNLYYPVDKNKFLKLTYYISYTGSITSMEALLEKHTNLIKYVKWKWYWSFITMFVANYSSRQFYKWFFKERITYETE